MELEQISPPSGENAPRAVTTKPQAANAEDSQVVQLSTWKFFTVLVSLCSAGFLAGYVSGLGLVSLTFFLANMREIGLDMRGHIGPHDQ
jgi:hypothetical protein